MEIKFWGTRGSIPVPGKNTIKFGGNTPCLSVDYGGDELIILDAGTGIRNLGDEIIRENKFKKIRLFISHTHWDHIQGLPFFAPVYSKDYEIKIYVYSYHAGNFKDILETQMHPKYFPVHHELLNAKIKFMRISAGKSYSIQNLKLSTITVNHTRKTLGFKLESGQKSIVYMTDNEIFYDSVPGVPTIKEISDINSAFLKFCFSCDYLIHDSMYTLKDYKEKIGWGHSNNVSSAIFAVAAKVKNLILFHYDPNYSDKKISKILNDTRKLISDLGGDLKCSAAKELQEINF